MTSIAFVTGSREGDARAPGALRRILKSRHLPVRFACAEQIHGSGIRIVSKLAHPRKLRGADGLLTDACDQPLAIFSADCVPIFLMAGEGQVVGLLHAGWRGVRTGILGKAIRLLRGKWHLKPSQIVAWSGPHIGSCCFKVHWDVARHFPSTRRRSGDRWQVDLTRELGRQAQFLSIRWLRKKPFAGCTMHGSRYFSYRRDKTAKRQVAVIMKRSLP